MSPGARAAVVGAVMAILVVVALAGAALWYLRSTGRLGRMDSPERVVVVFAAAGEDAAQVAQVVALVGPAGGVEFASVAASTTVPGTGAVTLGDVYPFGGARAVAAAAAPEVPGSALGWIEVPQASWEALLGAEGVAVTLTAPLNVFDGRRQVSFPEGEQTVAAKDVAALLAGVAYASAAEGASVREAVAAASCRALAKQTVDGSLPRGVTTNISPVAVQSVSSALAAVR